MWISSLKQAVEADINLRYVTKGHLSTPRQQYNPETGWIKLSLNVPDHIWQPKQGLQKWYTDFRTFVEVRIHVLMKVMLSL